MHHQTKTKKSTIMDQLNQGNILDQREILSLDEVLNKLNNMIRTEFPLPFWLRCDISKVNLYPYSGHAYPELVQKSNGTIVAQTKAIIWKSDFQRINDKFKTIVGEGLQDGISVVCRARMTFHAVYGFSIIISDIDPDLTLGKLEKERIECIQRLQNEKLFNLNKQTTLATLPKRLAIISVPSSKGYSDFMQTLQLTKDKYNFFIHLFPSLLQGDNASTQLIEALNTIEGVVNYFDCVLIIRGGGGDIGLHCYNNYELCHKIATFPIPVLTGIGHSTNETVAESISFANFITPTALAEFILNKFKTFDDSLEAIKQNISKYSKIIIKEEFKNLSYLKNFLITNSKNIIDDKHRNLSYLKNFLTINARNIIEKEKSKIANDEKYLSALNPINILRKGYTITSTNGHIIQSYNQVTKGDKIETITSDGKFYSTAD